MISIDAKGMNETIAMFENLTKETDGALKKCVYKGAGVVADSMKDEVKNIKTQTGKQTGKQRLPYDYEKNVLIENLGIAPIKNKGSVNTKIGFDGYYENKRGELRPVPLLANSINAGTSFLKKQPFLSKTVRASQANCVEEMQQQLDEEIRKEIRS